MYELWKHLHLQIMYFCCFGHSWLFLKSKGFLGILHLRYISRVQFFFHSFNFNETVRGRIKCYWSRGNNILIVFPSFFFFFWKNKTKLFWFVRSTLLCSPRHFRVFVILHSTTFHVEYNFWIENLLRFCTRAYRYIALLMSINNKLHYIFITWFKVSSFKIWKKRKLCFLRV